MSDTPRTDAAYFAKGATLYDLAGEAKKLERELAAAKERIEFLRSSIAKSQEEITQICGKALCYPWYKNDQKNFPGATEQTGVCVGEHVAETIVAELADKYAKANERIKRLEDVLRRMLATDGGDGVWSATRFYDARQDAVALIKDAKS